MLILDINDNPRRKNFLDLTFSNDNNITISREVCLKENLFPGKEISEEELASLIKEENFLLCYKASLNLLKYRPRSELEIKGRLLRKGFLPEVIEKVLINLKRLSLVDDKTFAALWADSRKTSKSKRLILQELKQKGIFKDIAMEVTADIDEEDSALNIARKRARFLQGLGSTKFQQKIIAYLFQKGFNYEVSKKVANIVSSEIASSNGDKKVFPIKKFPH